jgi:hypothetical protein
MPLAAKRDDYMRKRNEFAPSEPRLVIVAESPPTSGLYFYDTSGRVSEPLFAAMMRQLGCSPSTKEEGLREVQRQGWILVDATYRPVNGMSDRERDEVIMADYPLLRADIEALLPGKKAPIVLVKANVCRLLEPRLVADGFTVLNKGRVVYFPSTGRQANFHRQFGGLMAGG